MASISIHDLDRHLSERLQERAQKHGRTLEAEIIDILQKALVAEESSQNLVEAIAQHFQEFDEFEIPLPPGKKFAMSFSLEAR